MLLRIILSLAAALRGAVAITLVPSYEGGGAIVGSTLYYIGGRNSTFIGMNNMYSLDLSQPFNPGSPPWQEPDLTYGSGNVLNNGIAEQVVFSLGGKLWSEGGIYGFNTTAMQAAYALPHDLMSYDSQSNMWTAPSVGGTPPQQVRTHAVTVDVENSIAYFFGGTSDRFTGFACPQAQCLSNTTYSFNAKSLQWGTINPVQNGVAVPKAWKHTITFANGKLYQIGGEGNFNGSTSITWIPLTTLYVYDIGANAWSTITPQLTSNVAPSTRVGHSAVLHPDGTTIIVYGGENDTVIFSELWALDTVKNTWTLLYPGTPAAAIAFHQAALLGDLMFIMFGSQSIYVNGDLETAVSTLQLYNITTGQPVISYTPSTSLTTITQSQGSSPISTGGTSYISPSNNSGPFDAIGGIGGLVGIIAGVVVIFGGALLFFCFRKRKVQDPKQPKAESYAAIPLQAVNVKSDSEKTSEYKSDKAEYEVQTSDYEGRNYENDRTPMYMLQKPDTAPEYHRPNER